MYVALGFALFDLEDCLAMGAIFAATDSVATLQVRRAAPCLCLAGHMSSGGGLCINSKGAWS